MPSALSVIRGRLQIVLDDAGTDFWTTAELDAHIQRALEDLSHHVPQEKLNLLSTGAGADANKVDISTLTERVRIVATEYPTAQVPRSFVRFSIWKDVLTILGESPTPIDDVNVYWHALHTINGTDTLPEDQEETLIFGAAARACDQQQADSTNVLATGGPATGRNWGSLARHFRTQYEARLHPRRGIKQTRFYRPDEPTATQDSDPGP